MRSSLKCTCCCQRQPSSHCSQSTRYVSCSSFCVTWPSCSRLTQSFGTRPGAVPRIPQTNQRFPYWALSKPYFERMWGWNSHSWNGDLGVLRDSMKFQSSIIGVKTPRIGVFLISLESYRIVDVENGLAWAIWTFAAHIMAKRKAGNQTGSLTLNH